MYSVYKLHKWNIADLWKVSEILYKCGRNMASTQGLHHWDNIRLKWWTIVALCALKNDIYLVCKEEKVVATFQTRKHGDTLLFQKLATLPTYAGGGIGTFCLNEIEQLGRTQGCKAVICEVYDKSVHAMEFYIHRGYVVNGTTETRKYVEWKLKKEL